MHKKIICIMYVCRGTLYMRQQFTTDNNFSDNFFKHEKKNPETEDNSKFCVQSVFFSQLGRQNCWIPYMQVGGYSIHSWSLFGEFLAFLADY